MKKLLFVVLYVVVIPFSHADSFDLDKDVKKEAALIRGPKYNSQGDVTCRSFQLVSSQNEVDRDFDDYGNMLEDNGECHNEIALFSESHGALLKPDVIRWTDSSDDDLRLNPPEIIKVPTVVWIVHGTQVWPLTRFATEKLQTQYEVGKANGAFKDAKCGVEIEVVEYVNATKTLDDPTQKLGCGMIETILKPQVGYDPNRMNVYIVEQLQNPERGGVACTAQADNVIIMKRGRAYDLLIHEFGHYFGLKHTTEKSMPEVDNENIMSYSENKSKIVVTAGQCYRINFDNNSYINKAGLRDGPTKKCKHKEAADEECPGLRKMFTK